MRNPNQVTVRRTKSGDDELISVTHELGHWEAMEFGLALRERATKLARESAGIWETQQAEHVTSLARIFGQDAVFTVTVTYPER